MINMPTCEQNAQFRDKCWLAQCEQRPLQFMLFIRYTYGSKHRRHTPNKIDDHRPYSHAYLLPPYPNRYLTSIESARCQASARLSFLHQTSPVSSRKQPPHSSSRSSSVFTTSKIIEVTGYVISYQSGEYKVFNSIC